VLFDGVATKQRTNDRICRSTASSLSHSLSCATDEHLKGIELHAAQSFLQMPIQWKVNVT
jgi:hypothetical protein